MAHRIVGYNFWSDDGKDKDVFYWPSCDERLAEKDDVRFIVGQLWNLHKEGRKPIVAIFLPSEDEMERIVDPQTGEIIELEKDVEVNENLAPHVLSGEFVQEPNVSKALAILEPSTDAMVQACLNQVAEIEKWAEAFTVTSLADEKRATNDISVIIKIEQEAEKRRKEIVDPSRLYVEHVNAFFKSAITGPLSRAKATYGNKIVAFTNKQKEESKRVAAANEFAVRQALAQANAANQPVVLPALESQVQPPKTIRADIATGSIRTKRKWKFKDGLSETEIMAQLPDRWKCPDTKRMDTEVEKNLRLTEGDFNGIVEFFDDDRYQTLGRKVK